MRKKYDEIRVYSDGSTSQGVGVADSIILTENEYIGSVMVQYTVEKEYQTELYGVLQALRYLRREKILCDKIVMYVDAESIVKYFKKLVTGQEKAENLQYAEIWTNIMSYTRDYYIEMKHIPGHMLEHNPNKACDLASGICRRCDTLI